MDEDKKRTIIEEINALNMPAWWDLNSAKKLYEKEKNIGTIDDEELYMAILPDEMICKSELPDVIIQKVDNQNLFRLWANHVNDILSNGYPDMHPEYHYNLCKEKLMDCYLCFVNNVLISSATIINNHGNASLEFVATKSEYRQKGFAKHICIHAISESFSKGIKIITLRAANDKAKILYKKIGFKIYNQMM
jgi:ribosomal protein S18 acetylase RimI-like enzyme